MTFLNVQRPEQLLFIFHFLCDIISCKLIEFTCCEKYPQKILNVKINTLDDCFKFSKTEEDILLKHRKIDLCIVQFKACIERWERVESYFNNMYARTYLNNTWLLEITMTLRTIEKQTYPFLSKILWKVCVYFL